MKLLCYKNFLPKYFFYRRVKDNYENLGLFLRYLQANNSKKYDKLMKNGFYALFLIDVEQFTDLNILIKTNEFKKMLKFLKYIYKKDLKKFQCRNISEQIIF
jgi:hypothetical protein